MKVAVIGGGPSGFMTAISALSAGNHDDIEITVFEKNEPLKTLLYTGGGRCNLSNATWDIKELAGFFPRGEKFLYSVFSRFDVGETITFLDSIGVTTYIQDDNRIFPASDKAGDVKDALIKKAKNLGVNIINGAYVSAVEKIQEGFFVTVNDKKHKFDKVVITTGGRYKSNKVSGFELAEKSGHTVTELKPALSGLITKEKDITKLSGLSLSSVEASIFFDSKEIYKGNGDLLFSHQGITGPLAYKISSYCAFIPYSEKSPLKSFLNLCGYDKEDLEKQLLENLNNESKKDIINIINSYVPKSLASLILEKTNISSDKKASQISKNDRQLIVKELTSFELNIIDNAKDGEIVTAGGVSLDEVDSKTMESKLVKGLYFCGEVLNIDGLTGGFNLQACWSEGFVCGNNI